MLFWEHFLNILSIAELLFLGELSLNLYRNMHCYPSQDPKRVYQKLFHIAILHLLQQCESTTLSLSRECTKQTNKTQRLEKLD